VGFDPVGFSNFIDIKFLQEAEIKHCRVAMLGALGFIFSEFVKLPGDVHAVSSVAAHDAAVASGALSQILIVTSIFEVISIKAVQEMLEGSGRAPGYFGFDPLKFSEGKSQAVKDDFVVKELSNGRLAMLAFGGMITGAVLTGKGFPYI
jgi:light-harvesting complex I chlorophyll a/b binding protein 1